MEQKVITFYRFAEFPDHREWKPVLEELGKKEKITGSLILAEEGINAPSQAQRKDSNALSGTSKRTIGSPSFRFDR